MIEQPALLKPSVTDVDKYKFEPIKGCPMIYRKEKPPFLRLSIIRRSSRELTARTWMAGAIKFTGTTICQ